MRSEIHRKEENSRDRRNAHRSRRERRWRLGQPEALEPRVVLSIGGGTTSVGLLGTYYPNTTLSGSPAFSRTDVRVDFDWGTSRPGGSTSPDFASLGASGYSVRWTGQLIPRFTETYTFSVTSAGGVRFWIRPAGAPAWYAMIDDWTNHETAKVDTGSLALITGLSYDVKMEYVASAAHPVAQLAWASKSTLPEVIDPLGQSGYNFLPYSMPEPTFADAFLQGRDQWLPKNGAQSVPTDANGWPLTDGKKVLWEGRDPSSMAGTYTLTFQGKATVTVEPSGTLSVGGTAYGTTLPSGVGYNPATNTTTALYTTPGVNILSLTFTNSQRTANAATNTGVSQVHLMRPTTVGGTTDYAPGTLFAAPVKDALSHFTAIRYATALIDSGKEVNASDRTLPTYFNAVKDRASMAWENLIMLSNEIGKDMYLTLPMEASDDYVTNLAKVIRYGSDGVKPYSSPQANPVFPPLNPNLRVYLEWSNELWNPSYPQHQMGVALAADAIARGTPDGKIINYDGQGDWRRWAAIRTVDTSNIFRSVFGDDAMGDRIRVLLEYRNGDASSLASKELMFIDNYFNNGDGVAHVADPHPVSYFLWGGGAANYYEATNPRGYQTAITFSNAGFETPALGAGKSVANPTGTPWTFTGDAGIASNGATVLDNAPAAPEGTQVAYLGSSGSISTTVNFTAKGTFAVDFSAAGLDGRQPAIDIYFDGQRITPQTYDIEAYTSGPYAFLTGRSYGLDYRKYNATGSVPFQVTTTGTHTISIVSRGDERGHAPAGWYLLLDQFQITSLDAIFDGLPVPPVSTFPSFEALVDSQASYARTFGLHVASYEGGWGVGGERNRSPLLGYAKFTDPRSKKANQDTIDAYMKASGDLYTFGAYDHWENTRDVMKSPLMQSIDASNQVLPLPHDNGIAVPATLQPSQPSWSYGMNKGLAYAIGFTSWNILIPRSGNYTFTTQGAHDTNNGTMALVVDATYTLGQGNNHNVLTGTVYLTAGMHAVMIKNLGGRFMVPNVVVTEGTTEPPPAAPSGAKAAAASTTQINLNWTDNSNNESGFKIYRATDAGFTQNVVLVTITAANVTTLQDKGLTPNTTYYYRLAATNTGGDSPFSNTASAKTPGVPASVAGRVFQDMAGDGKSDTSDPALTGWVIQVFTAAGTLVASQTSSGSGQFTIGGLAAGSYTVKETPKSGWIQTGASAAGYTITLSAGQTLSGLDFGNFKAVTVSGLVYNDVEGSGQPAGNPVLSGWVIDLVSPAGKVVSSTTSGKDGKYTFSGVGPGTFLVRESLKTGWMQVQPAAPADGYSITTSSGTNLTARDFGNFQLVTLTGNLFGDGNGDGVRSGSEAGLSGWKIELRDPSGKAVSTSTTNSSGNFTFSSVGPGQWTVSQVTRDGWVQTLPAAALTYLVPATSGQNVGSLNFGDRQVAALTPSVVIDDLASGYTETGTWYASTGGYGGDNRVATTVKSGTATAKALWSFTGLDKAARYDVYVTYRSSGAYSPAASYVVADGSLSLAKTAVNQTIPVTMDQGLTMGSYGGVAWVQLGSYTPTSGKLNVTLDNLTSGSLVDADSVLIVKRSSTMSLQELTLPPSTAASPVVAVGPMTLPMPTPTLTLPSSGRAGTNPVLESLAVPGSAGSPIFLIPTKRPTSRRPGTIFSWIPD